VRRSLPFVCFLFLVSSPLLCSEINVYFTHSVDTTIANPSRAHGFVSLDEKLIERISQAQHSIDFCFYNIKRQNIVDTLIAAHNRGVAVRVITEDDHVDNQAIQDMTSAGITVIDDSFGGNPSSNYMHHKFAVFDGRDSTSLDDDWIWTGSYNITDEGTESNANNVVEIQHTALAQAYTIEFNEMWGSDSMIPNPDSARFHSHKMDNTPHHFTIDSIPIELYFSPSDQSTEKINNAILTADASIYFCILAYTRQDVCDTMKTRWDSGVSVKGVFDRGDWLGQYSKSRDMTGDPTSDNPWSPPAPVYSDSVNSPWGPKMLHHKYMIIDSDFDSTAIVITGSQNWSNNGELRNDENILIIHSAGIANQYLQEFAERYREAGGQYVAIAESEDSIQKPDVRFQLHAFPNPFSERIAISLDGVSEYRGTGVSEIQIIDITGRVVRNLPCPVPHAPGAMQITWDGKDRAGKAAPPGIYFLKVGGKPVGKMVKVR
jgi:phosphatidylserine/phosphatidylglycerophosphate/cardiolipin synthase-like enzyme